METIKKLTALPEPARVLASMTATIASGLLSGETSEGFYSTNTDQLVEDSMFITAKIVNKIFNSHVDTSSFMGRETKS